MDSLQVIEPTLSSIELEEEEVITPLVTEKAELDNMEDPSPMPIREWSR